LPHDHVFCEEPDLIRPKSPSIVLECFGFTSTNLAAGSKPEGCRSEDAAFLHSRDALSTIASSTIDES
jgi:hypothetical protein